MGTFRWRIASHSHWLAVLAMLPVFSGCNSIQVHLGTKLYLAKTPVSSMSVSLTPAPGIAPGEKSPLVVTFTQPDGKILKTEGKGKGKVLWADLAVRTTLVTANKKGVLKLAHDPRKSDGQSAHIVVTVPSHPDLSAELDIPVRYDYPFRADCDGSGGNNGLDGLNGTSGSPGLPGSLDPDSPSPGGNGGDGTNGSNGSDGGAGGDAPDVEVVIALRAGPHPLLEAGVTPAGGKQRFYLIDPQGGSLTITALGGAGGSGGRGGRGGSGGSGGIGTPNGSSGNSGTSGMDGSRGMDGGAGRIAVTYDPSAQPYLSAIRASPQAAMTEGPVAPLW